jgi:hypothetical protein
MAPNDLRTLSLRTFKTTLGCGIVGSLLGLGLPNPGYADPASVLPRVLATAVLSLLLVAVVTNFVSLVTGALAWARGGGRCAWIVVCAILLLVPIAALALIFS